MQRQASKTHLRFGGPAAALWVAAGASLLALCCGAQAQAASAKPWVLHIDTVPFEAHFALRVDDGKTKDDSSGALFLKQNGSLCVAVERPLHQQLFFDNHQLLIYYPDDKVILRAKPGVGQIPPMIDALYTGFIDPSVLVPPTSKILEQVRTDGGSTLTTRWSLEDKDGKPHGQLRAVETRDGTARLELLNDDGKLMRSYEFADRVKLGKASIPRDIKVRYVKPNAPDRTDRWTLDAIVPEKDENPGPSGCANYPKTLPVKDIRL
ncbi:MAG: LolA-like protein [Deltaproteobacteria bacterium]